MNEIARLRGKLQNKLDEIERLKTDLEEYKASFDLRWKSDMRAIKMWQAAHPGNDLVWPSQDDLCVWLLGELDAAKALLSLAKTLKRKK